jgi:putative transposase
MLRQKDFILYGQSPMKKVTEEHISRAKATLSSRSTASEVERHKLAASRYTILKDYKDGHLTAKKAMSLLGLQKTVFYQLIKRMEGATSYRTVVTGSPGRKDGLMVTNSEVLKLIEEMFLEHYPDSKKISVVWKACQAQADNRRMLRPSYHTVKRWINSKGERLLHAMTHSSDQTKQKYEARAGYKVTTRPLEWVQFDHTVVDLLVVDENDRNVIIGRPWISLAVDLHTRVVLGFYLSFLPPSAVSVAMLMESCVLPKDPFLAKLGLPGHLLPMHGLPEVIHTDNAKEFISDVFVLNAKDFGIDVQHRDIPQKHQGGHIESLIGKLMLNTVHGLPGSTGSNTVQRKHLRSAKRAGITLTGLREILCYHFHAYHDSKHSALGKTPEEAWNEHYAKYPGPMMLDAAQHEDFKYRFYPEIHDKQIVPEGIELFRRFYFDSAIKNRVREKVLVKYDPYDLSFIFVNLDGIWTKIPCVRNNFNKSIDFETYRWQRQQKGVRDGTMGKAGAQSFSNAHKVKKAEVALTTKEKRQRKAQKGKEDYKEQAATHNKTPNNKEVNDFSKTKAAATTKPNPKVQKKEKANVYDISNLFQRDTAVDFDEAPVFYDSNMC